MTRTQPMVQTIASAGLTTSLHIPDASSEGELSRVDTDLLIPGRGEPLHHAAVIYESHSTASGRGTLVFAGSRHEIPSTYARVRATLHVPVLMPGLWDCHVTRCAQLIGRSDLNLEQIAFTASSTAGFRIARDAVATLNAGITSSIDEGWIPGPRVYPAGSVLSQTAGHGDLHTVPLELMHHKMTEIFPVAVADGVVEAIKQTRMQIRRGASLIKAAQFTGAELRVIVEEATRTKMIVAAHAHGTEGIAALDAGVKTIEHGSYLTKEAIELMLAKDAILVAARSIQQYGLEHPGDMAPESYKKMAETVHANKASYAAAIKAGVRIALGTDLGISSPTFNFRHGMSGKEFWYAVEAGMTPPEAIEAGTANGLATLGPQAPLSGQLKEGYDADFIALDQNALGDIDVLSRAYEVKFVGKGGKRMKKDGESISIL